MQEPESQVVLKISHHNITGQALEQFGENTPDN